MSTAIYYHSADLPWTVSQEDAGRFQRTLITVSVVILILAIIFPFLPTYEQVKPLEMEVPARYAKLIMERKAPPPPPPPQQLNKLEPKPEPKKEAIPKKIKTEKKKPKPKPVAEKRATAREKASRSGLLAFSDDLSSLTENAAITSIKKTQAVTSAGRAAKAERAILTSNFSRGSKGIKTAHLSRDTGDTKLTGRETTKVKQVADIAMLSQPSRKSAGGLPMRNDEDIQLVFDRNKGKLYSLYNRALRKDSTLKGKVVLKITIMPSGKVTAIEIISSALNAPGLEKKLKARIKMFNFGAKDVATTTITYPIDFFPV